MKDYIKIAYMIMLDPAMVPIFINDREDVDKAVKFLKKYSIDDEEINKKIRIVRGGVEMCLDVNEILNSIQNGEIHMEEGLQKMVEKSVDFHSKCNKIEKEK